MKEKFLSINLKKLTMCFISAFILSAGIFAISSFYMVDNAKAQMSLLDKYNQDQANAKAAGDAWKSSDNMQSYLNLDSSQQNTASSSSQKNGDGSKIFSTISSKMWKAVGDLRKIAYVLAGFGMIAFTFGAIFNKISWKHFGNIMISLFILSIMTPLIEYIAYGEGAQNKLKFGYQYVAPGDHASLEAQNSCETGGNCPEESKQKEEENNNCEETCQGQCLGGKCQPCPSDTPYDAETKTCQLPEVEVKPEENLEDLKRDCYEGGGTYDEAAKKCNYEQEADVVNDPCQGLKDEKYTKCANAKKEPEKPGACSAEDPKCEGGYQSKGEVCAGKEGKEKKDCEKAVDKHNQEVNKAYKDEQKAYEKEQKEIAKDKYEARKDNIAPGQEVNCDGLSASQCSRLQSKQQKADDKQAKQDQKDGIEQRYKAAMEACHGDPDCEKDAKKAKNQETSAMNKQNFASAMQKTNSAINEAKQRFSDAQKAVGGAMQAVNSVTTGIHNATNSINTITAAANNMGAAFNGDGNFLDKTKAFFQGTATITNATGSLGAAAGNTLGGVAGGLSNSANAFQDLTSSSAQRDQNIATRSQGGSSNVFSGVMNDVATGSRTTGNTIHQAGLGVSGAADAAGRTTQTITDTANSAQYMLDEINRSKNTLGH